MNEKLLKEGLSALGIDLNKRKYTLLCGFIEELALWNKKYNLVNAAGDEIITKHILDSLSGLRLLKSFPHRKIADIGSGGGFPGIPLAVFLPRTEFFLIERSGKKCGFLRNVSGILSLNNIVIKEMPLDKFNIESDIVTFRAFSKINNCLKDLLGATREGGIIAAYKGKKTQIESEIKKMDHRPHKLEIHPLDVPFLKEERHMVIIHKTRGN